MAAYGRISARDSDKEDAHPHRSEVAVFSFRTPCTNTPTGQGLSFRYSGKGEGTLPPANYSSLHQVINVARILIVDDDESARIVLSTILERAGHETFVAEDGEEAVSLCLGLTFEVVVTDLQMHAVHGLELITLLRDLSPRPTIIAISATGSVQLDMAQALGATVTLSKPFTVEEVRSAVTDAVAGQA